MSSIDSDYWTAFYTKPRNEKKVAARLHNKGFEVYCPTQTVLKQWSDRKKKIQEPIFTSYLFAKVNEPSRVEILMDSGIVRNVYWLGKPAVIREAEITEIKSFIGDYTNASIKLETLSPGDKALVASGPLSGQNGLIRHIKGNRTSLIILSMGLVMQANLLTSELKKVG